MCIWMLCYGCFPFVRTDVPDGISVIMRISLGINTIQPYHSVNDSVYEGDGFSANILFKKMWILFAN